ncbi:3-dehydroquinate synthase [Corynebacterium pelargi]|uniref:3-dehydroquinate synthase n=1 Tax=Corynebacterium pelargi TaxID=1471400 RepID=A0A410W8L7_9CORY|nr:3-dehydroquinate synthase [Corynebacterium pelargi]QAU52291.1 3-dehydroquinate synthase [Corynebacterium pelargi]GGG68747.1 3-dehydroquinate synthase [Corynebacterium pelargi]
MQQHIDVNGAAPYRIHIGQALSQAVAACAKEQQAHKVAVISQPSMRDAQERLCATLEAQGLSPVAIAVPDAEAAKTLEVAGQCWDALGAAGFSRRDVVIGLGGGAVTDLAGFVAASWMRGIKVIQVPTTLLAMVDAAVGGKTGINTAAGKNLVGAFHEPAAVFIDLDYLATLPEEELISGSAEIIKTGFIADEEILRLYESDAQACLRVAGHLPELIRRSVAVKADVVGKDLKESSLREILNYGHTFGHAVELHQDFRWRHGNAVAVGMMFVAQLAYGRGLIDAPLVDRHEKIIASVGLPTRYASGHFDELFDGMTRDKKNRDGAIRFVGLEGVGKTTRIEGPSLGELRQAYEAISA